ncbi:hypothetical protein QBC47DRAFT_336716 [Echria macrotheca]|uniref:Uncharacterized protein n=1 Tax=Echria macrotheca TaxID=438768 RepID=A0AAJ0FFD6_9PEZI|nr:hypothetical protein QBC47DRAFT_336716 [Echria macrotheca]
MDIHDIRTWADAHLEQDNLDSSTLGIAGALFDLILRHAISFNRSIYQQPSIAKVSDHPRALHREIERLVLWKSRFSGPERDLDTILSRSLELQHCVVLTLHGLGSALERWIAHTPGDEYGFADGGTRMMGLRRVLDQAAGIIDIPLNDEDPPESDDDCLLVTDGRGLANDMSWYIDCLDDLSTALENPVADVDLANSAHPQPETFKVSSPEALAFCRRIRDRFKKLSKRLVERFGEANADRTRRLKAARDESEAMGQAAEPVDNFKPVAELGNSAAAPSEALFSESVPRPTETTLSSFQRESVFDTSKYTLTTVSSSKKTEATETDEDDNASLRSFVSLSTTFSTASLGRPRVPPLPYAALERQPFTCPFCQKLTTGVSTRREWKKHVYDDLRPYLCTVEACDQGTTMFRSHRIWAQHEATHRVQDWEGETCPFCDDSGELDSSAVSSHVAKHMREISLAALAAHSGFFDESDASTDGEDSISGQVLMHKHENAAFLKSDAALEPLPDGDRGNERSDTNREWLLDSMRFDQMHSRLASIRKPQPGTCTWLIKHPSYLDWLDTNKLDEHHGILWIKGKPGTGKSTLVKFAFENAQKNVKDGEIVISFFFNARGTFFEKSTTGMYQSLLVQILERAPQAQDGLQHVVPQDRSIGYIWASDTLKNLFENAIRSIGSTPVICFIDAVDECDQTQVQDMLAFFEQLGQSAVLSGLQFHIIFSSRHYPAMDIERGITIVLEAHPEHEADIDMYVGSKLRINGDRETFQQELLNKSSGVFLWVVLLVNMLNQQYEEGESGPSLRRSLQQFPTDLYDFFLEALSWDSDTRDETQSCLEWVLFAQRPLEPAELYFAVFSANPEDFRNFHPGEVSTREIIQFINSSSKGLVEISNSKQPSVQFIHESARTFLLTDGLCHVWPDQDESSFERQRHGRLAQCCMNYLDAHVDAIPDVYTIRDLDKIEELTSVRQEVKAASPFLEYCTHNVLYHVDQAGAEAQKSLLLNFPRTNWIKARNLFKARRADWHTRNSSLLYILAEYGMSELIRAMPHSQCCFEAEDERYGPPIFAAIALQNTETVRALVETHLGVQPPERFLRRIPDIWEHIDEKSELRSWDFRYSSSKGVRHYVMTSGSEPLWTAYFLMSNADTDSRDPVSGKTPLELAARNGYGKVVRQLLGDKEIDANTKHPITGKTPLCLAAEGGHEDIVELLLVLGEADMGAKDAEGMTALILARKNGHDSVADRLIEWEASIGSHS